RFWPLSRQHRPKQLLKLTRPDKSLLAEAVARVEPLFGKENVYIATGRHLVDALRDADIGVPDENILAEPCKRNTAGCLCYVAAKLYARADTSPDQTSMAVLTADHQIEDTGKFREALDVSLSAAEQNDALVTIGIRPTRAATGYGYIEMNSQEEPAAGSDSANPVFPVVRFLEKPDRETAQRFLATGHYLWNSGMFFWRLNTFRDKLAQANPEMVSILDNMAEAFRNGDREKADAYFESLENISIDYALMEKIRELLVTPASFQWDDVGSWDALDRTFPHDENENVTVGHPVVIDSERCIVYNEPGAEDMAVSVVGMNDVVVVVSRDGVLVVPKDNAQDVKKAVEELRKRNAKQL
ncbi:MAG: mannose-1-phosphate guanylyltransferase, partial [Lentisphaeria bacterium]